LILLVIFLLLFQGCEGSYIGDDVTSEERRTFYLSHETNAL